MSNGVAIEPFSAGYGLVCGAEVFTVDDAEATMDFELFQVLKQKFGEPVVGWVDGLHYYFKPEQAIPANTVAVPETNHEEPESLLIQR
jgi:hypothetical protein